MIKIEEVPNPAYVDALSKRKKKDGFVPGKESIVVSGAPEQKSLADQIREREQDALEDKAIMDMIAGICGKCHDCEDCFLANEYRAMQLCHTVRSEMRVYGVG